MWARVRRHLKKNILYSTFLNNMGGCYAAMGDVVHARSCFEESIRFTPDGVNYEPPRIGLRQLDRS